MSSFENEIVSKEESTKIIEILTHDDAEIVPKELFDCFYYRELQEEQSS